MFHNPFGVPEGDEPRANDGVGEAQSILQGLLAELPDKARTLVAKTNRDLIRLQEQTDAEVAKIREQAERRIQEVEDKADMRRRAFFAHAMEQLEPMQKELFRMGELGQALATYVQIQTLRAKADSVLPDPGNLLRFQHIGKTYVFHVTGRSEGPVWGTDVYTSDSHLGTAAVHAGALEDGEEGRVRVSLVDMSGMAIVGSHRNGVMSHDWGPYRVGYRVSRAGG